MRCRDARERGFSLVEALLATAVLAIAVLIALFVYDAARKSFKKAENVTEQQQAVRIAFDRLTSDLRSAGYNTNPDGASNRPDEQIEAAYDTAITLRADFNQSLETALGGGAFQAVSTGNDEIVTYVLAKPDGSSSGTLTFNADVQDVPRQGNVVSVSIPNVSLLQANPPYTLYRITLNPDTSTYGNSGFIVRTPLVDNVYSMTFKYYDQNGVQLNPTFDLTTTSDDIGGAEAAAAKQKRTNIRRVAVDLVGVTRDPDLTGWTDTTDPYPATQKKRKFELVSDIQPRNLGLKGVKDLQADVTPPSKPATPALHPGHCGGLVVTWNPNPSSDQVASYRVLYGTTSAASDGSTVTVTNFAYIFGLTTGSTYYVKIEAIDAAGNVSPDSNVANATVTNTTTPKAISPLPTASTTLNGQIQLSWAAVTQNTSDVAGDPQTPTIRDLAGYRVYRSTSSGFTPAAGNRVADETLLKATNPTAWADAQVVNCRRYYYQMTAVDQCGLESAASGEFSGRATTSVAPAAPQNTGAYVAGPNRVSVKWQAVTQDTAGTSITIQTYNIYRSGLVAIASDPNSASYSKVGTVTDGSTAWLDTAAPTVIPGTTFYYRITAADDCVNESVPSTPVAPQCAFTGTIQFTTPANGSPVSGVVPTTAQVVGGSDTYTTATFTFLSGVTGTATTQTVASPTGSPPTWTVNWIADPPGPYTITVVITNAAGCTASTSIQVVAGPTVGCCLGTNPGQTGTPTMIGCSPNTGSTKCTQLSYRMYNNTCLTSVAIETMNVTWTNGWTTALLSRVNFDTTTIWNAGATASPASTTFSAPKPAIPTTRNSSNPVFVYYVFNNSMSKQNGAKNQPVATTYTFRLLDSSGNPTSITGSCGPSGGFTMNIPDPNAGP